MKRKRQMRLSLQARSVAEWLHFSRVGIGRDLDIVGGDILCELTDKDTCKIANTYHIWQSDPPTDGFSTGGFTTRPYEDIPGFCKSAMLEEILKQGYVLTPGRYVGVAAKEEDDEPFDQKMRCLSAEWRALQAKARRLDTATEANLREVGYGE